jgi:hypothetical protein
MLFSTSGRSGSSAAAVQILGDIDKTLDAALDICSSNKDLLTDAERTKFFNTHTRYKSIYIWPEFPLLRNTVNMTYFIAGFPMPVYS